MKEEDAVELQVKLRLPAPLAREAEAGGLLQGAALEALLREELRRRRVDRLFEAVDRLAALPTKPMTEAEVEAEIQAVRRQRRSAHAGGS